MNFIAIPLVMLATASVTAQLNEDEWNLLVTVAEARVANLEKINTWCGKAVKERKRAIEDDSYEVFEYHEADFVVDRASGAKRWSITAHDADYIHDPVPLYGGTWDNRDEPKIYASILTGQHTFQFNPSSVKDGVWRNQLIVQERERFGPTRETYSSDPFLYFAQRSQDVNDFINIWQSKRETERFANLAQSVVRTEDTVTWERHYGTYSARYEFDLSKGGNMISMERSDGGYEVHFEWTHDSGANVWLPKLYEQRTRGTMRGKQIYFGDKVTFIHHELNAALDKSEFQVERLGVKPGSRVTDYVQKIVYEYGNPESIQKIRFSAEENRWTSD